jgi:putative ATP-dependent endonuclease of OLD family
MYLASAHIKNYRCFADETIQFSSGVNVLLGENNSGKTTVIRALGLVLDQRSRRRPDFFDFHHPCADPLVPPAISIAVTFRSSATDSIEDRALVATWLTTLDSPWEAQVTYTFQLEPDDDALCRQALSAIAPGNQQQYQRVIESFLDKYVTRIYGGNLENLLKAESESLERISFATLEALRDAEREIFAGSNPLLKRLLKQVRDHGQTTQQKAARDQQFQTLAGNLGLHMRSRIDLNLLLQLVTDTGALEGGQPHLAENLTDEDVLNALRLHVMANGISLPAERNGLGYNNLIYISLVLASLDHQADVATQGSNATLFPILCIEEPEAHLHPALQYKLLKHLEGRVGEAGKNRQVFITTHSTHITSASPLDQLICLTIPENGQTPRVAYPGKCFLENAQGKDSKAYVERYLDATKSNLLFSKGIILVEGLAEQLLLPVMADHLACSLEEHHVALIPVGGSTFKHFLPLFGAGLTADKAVFALKRPVACLVDADPQRKPNNNARFEKCYPYELANTADYECKPVSGVITNLDTLCQGCENIMIAHGAKTFEYDLAFHNHNNAILVTDECTNATELRSLFGDANATPVPLSERLTGVRADTEHVTVIAERAAHVVATCYLESLETAKGSHALALAKMLKDAKGTPSLAGFTVPLAIVQAISFASRQPPEEAPAPESL